MDIQGSCHCGKISFKCKSHTPYPYMRCYCSICRKTAGGGGYAINIMAQADSLVVEGKEHVKVYRAKNPDGALSTNHRNFCGECGSCLWGSDPSYKQWIYPFASAIDTDLPRPPINTCIFLDNKPQWAAGADNVGEKDVMYDTYPEDSIEDTHKKNGWWIE
ncbi:Mss4-like protein [Powellomyces hirtus]|nr:Mss4-like protein [Powellomyces hirtus]